MKTKKIICLCVCLCLSLMVFSGCSKTEGARAAFDTMMQDLKSGDVARISPYFDLDAQMEAWLLEEKDGLKEAVAGLLGRMEYEIVSVEEKEDEVWVSAKVTMADFSQIIEQFLQKLAETVSSPQYAEQVDIMDSATYQTLMTEMMVQVIQEEQYGTTEETVTAKMVKQEGAWTVKEGGADFFGSLFANLTEAVLSLI